MHLFSNMALKTVLGDGVLYFTLDFPKPPWQTSSANALAVSESSDTDNCHGTFM
jgi:hypothetical protein